MLLCPNSNTRLQRARIKGGLIWFSPVTGGRLISMAMCRHFLGPHEAQELWMRSEQGEPLPELPCPSCRRPMRQVKSPGWIEHIEVALCRACFMVWFEAGVHPKLPHPHIDLDPNVQLAEQRVAVMELELDQIKEKDADDQLFGEGPPSLGAEILGFLGLPVQLPNRSIPEWPLVSAIVIVGTFFLFIFAHSSPVIEKWGYYPGNPFLNGGFNALSGAFLHANWIHLLGNLYFMYVFTDDVEEDLGSPKFLALILSTIVVGAFLSAMLGIQPDIPHIGLSGVVMAMMSYYALRYSKVRLAYLVPAIHYPVFSEGFFGRISGFRWIRMPVIWIYCSYLLFNLIGYFLIEKNFGGSISFSAHIMGAFTGFAFYSMWGRSQADKNLN